MARTIISAPEGMQAWMAFANGSISTKPFTVLALSLDNDCDDVALLYLADGPDGIFWWRHGSQAFLTEESALDEACRLEGARTSA